REGGLHRVVDGREVRIEAADGGVDVEPLAPETEPVVRKLLGLEFDLDSFAACATTEPVLARLVPALAGFRPPLAPDPFETLVTSISAQQVSLFSAFAVRNRLITAFGVRGAHAYAFPEPERLASASEDELVAVGFSRRKAEYIRPATENDRDVLRELWDEFQQELEPGELWDESWDEVWRNVEAQEGFVFLAETDGQFMGFAVGRMRRPGVAYLNDLYVRPSFR